MVIHPDLGAVNYAVTPVSDDPDTQVEQVIHMMQGYVREDSTRSEVVEVLRKAIQADPGAGVPEVVFWHVKRRIGYKRDDQLTAFMQPQYDAPFVEALVRPLDMATMCEQGECSRVGDCDDFAMYAAALLTAAHIPATFVTVAADSNDPTRYSHVYVAAYVDGVRVPLDTSHGDYPGWEVESRYGRRREWPVTGGGGKELLVWAGMAAVVGVVVRWARGRRLLG